MKVIIFFSYRLLILSQLCKSKINFIKVTAQKKVYDIHRNFGLSLVQIAFAENQSGKLHYCSVIFLMEFLGKREASQLKHLLALITVTICGTSETKVRI